MNKEDLNNSIFLIGPTCVGKSLLSLELSKRLNMQVVCIDELFMYVEDEIKGFLNHSIKGQNKFIQKCINDIKNDEVLGKNFKNKNLVEKQTELVYDYVDKYKSYVKMLGGLKPYYNIVKKFIEMCDNLKNDMEYIIGYSAVSTIMIQKIVKKLNYPVIFDTPGMFGLKLDDGKLNDKYKNYLKNNGLDIKLCSLDNEQQKMLENSKTIFLEPGQDYPIRNALKDSSINKLLLKHVDNYYDYANISITTNALFNHPENKYFNKRSFFDAKEYDIKEKLKNKCNINNICDEIVTMINDLNQVSQV